MSTNDAARFFDTSGCLNLSRPASGTRTAKAKQTKKNANRPGLIRGQVIIDLYNFDHIDFADSQYVLTSPRSLEACARLNIKPITLLPKKLADISTDKIRFSTLIDVHDEMEIERLAKLQCCREEREKIIREEEPSKPSLEEEVDSKSSYANKRSTIRGNATKVKLRPSTTATATRNRPEPMRNGTKVHHSSRPSSSNRPAQTISNIKTSAMRWPSSDSQNELRTSSSASFLDDVRRMDESLQRLGTSKTTKNERYINGLENVKQIIEQRVTHTAINNDLDTLTQDKNQYELLISHYDHELKIQKARENARRTEQEKEAERYESLMNDFVDQTMAEERRQNELRRKLEKLHHSRQLYEALQAKNHELQMVDVQKRRFQLLNEIKRKDRRAQDFVKEKQEANNLFRTLAKSSQDTREYIREMNENFDQKARRAELASSILVTKPKTVIDRRLIQSSIRT